MDEQQLKAARKELLKRLVGEYKEEVGKEPGDRLDVRIEFLTVLLEMSHLLANSKVYDTMVQMSYRIHRTHVPPEFCESQEAWELTNERRYEADHLWLSEDWDEYNDELKAAGYLQMLIYMVYKKPKRFVEAEELRDLLLDFYMMISFELFQGREVK